MTNLDRQHHPGTEVPQELIEASRPGVEEARVLMFADDRHFQQDLQQHGSQQSDRERADVNVFPIFGEQQKHDEIYQDLAQYRISSFA